MTGTPPRIAIYGVGQYGSLITRMATAKGWPVVAAFNRAGPKVGQDLGRVAGLGRDLGVIIQRQRVRCTTPTSTPTSGWSRTRTSSGSTWTPTGGSWAPG